MGDFKGKGVGTEGLTKSGRRVERFRVLRTENYL